MPDTRPPSGILQRLGPAVLLGALWAILPGVCGFILLARLGLVSDWLLDHTQTGLVLYAGIFAFAAGFGVLPTYAQAILGGWVFGFNTGFPAALAGIAGASLIGFAVARTVSRRRAQDVIASDPKAAAVRDALIGHGFWRTLGIVALLRLPPNSPFAVTNLVMAATGVPIVAYALGTAIGVMPRTGVAVFFAAAGRATGAKDIQAFIKEGPGPLVFIGGVVALVVVLAIVGAVGNAAVKRATATRNAEPGA